MRLPMLKFGKYMEVLNGNVASFWGGSCFVRVLFLGILTLGQL